MHMGQPVEMGVLTALFTVLYGLILLVAGKLVLKVMISIGGGLLGGYIAYLTMLRMGFGTLGSLAVFLLVFIIISLVSWFLFKIVLSILAAAPLWLIIAGGLGLSYSSLPALLILVILVALLYIISEKLVSVAASTAGLFMLYLGLSSLVNPLVALTVTVIALLLRIYLYVAFKW
ncbi:glycosyltransferase [Desulfurococcus amylolyticus]|uniref:glycosyltransferase n=1 Tax=Desulfurococcus amylolyticus TaxID=94694 RepID=UPI000A7AEAC4|nr:glycosyltransferase [Desulfurococcus amylolyticus]